MNFFKSLSNSHFTVQQIYNYLESIGSPVGTTTIYRHLEKFVADGIVKKYVFDDKKGACFEYINYENTSDEAHFHFKCNKCKKITHFECEQLKKVYNHFLEKHDMNIDLFKTVYYGICDKCHNNN